MKALTAYRNEMAAAAMMLAVCIGLFAAWNVWLRDDSTDVRKNTDEIDRLRSALRESNAEKQDMYMAFRDSMHAYERSLAAVMADTAGTERIIKKYDALREEHRSLSADSAVCLMRSRLRDEPVHGAGFDYSLLSD